MVSRSAAGACEGLTRRAYSSWEAADSTLTGAAAARQCGTTCDWQMRQHQDAEGLDLVLPHGVHVERASNDHDRWGTRAAAARSRWPGTRSRQEGGTARPPQIAATVRRLTERGRVGGARGRAVWSKSRRQVVAAVRRHMERSERRRGSCVPSFIRRRRRYGWSCERRAPTVRRTASNERCAYRGGGRRQRTRLRPRDRDWEPSPGGLSGNGPVMRKVRPERSDGGGRPGAPQYAGGGI